MSQKGVSAQACPSYVLTMDNRPVGSPQAVTFAAAVAFGGLLGCLYSLEFALPTLPDEQNVTYISTCEPVHNVLLGMQMLLNKSRMQIRYLNWQYCWQMCTTRLICRA